MASRLGIGINIYLKQYAFVSSMASSLEENVSRLNSHLFSSDNEMSTCSPAVWRCPLVDDIFTCVAVLRTRSYEALVSPSCAGLPVVG